MIAQMKNEERGRKRKNFMLKGKKILVLGETNFFEGIYKHLSNLNTVRIESPKTIIQLAFFLLWADFVWVEWAGKWCNIVSRLRPPCKTICRIHRGKIYKPHSISSHVWGTYDHVFFVSEQMKQSYIDRIPNNSIPEATSVLYNGIDLTQFSFKKQKPGYKIGAIAHTVFRKNIEMMVWIMRELVQIDQRYHLTIIGSEAQGDCLDAFMFNVKRTGLSENIHYKGVLNHDQIPNWLADKNIILSTSLHEGHPVGLNEAMARGIKPVIYEYPGSREVFPDEVLFDTVDGAVELITSNSYNSAFYYQWVYERFSLGNQLNEVDRILLHLDRSYQRRFKAQFLAKVARTILRRGTRRFCALLDN
jgi:glycosyltransferase involved in cell wall biosynthesis